MDRTQVAVSALTDTFGRIIYPDVNRTEKKQLLAANVVKVEDGMAQTRSGRIYDLKTYEIR